MSKFRDLFLFVTGAAICTRTPELIRQLVAQNFTVYSVVTPNSGEVAPAEQLMDAPGNRWISQYEQPPLDRYPFGMLLVAPCTFNTFNKLAHGIADNLATSMIADGLGAGCPVLIAPSMNHGLWAHPQTTISRERLVSWRCQIIGPQITSDKVTMVSTEEIVRAVVQRRNEG